MPLTKWRIVSPSDIATLPNVSINEDVIGLSIYRLLEGIRLVHDERGEKTYAPHPGYDVVPVGLLVRHDTTP